MSRAPWIQITLERRGSDVLVSSRGSGDEEPAPHLMGQAAVNALDGFAKQVSEAARKQAPLGDALSQAQAIYSGIMAEGALALSAELQATSKQPVVLRLKVEDAALRAVPWEAVAQPGFAMSFWGTSANIFPVRAVSTSSPWQPREVQSAVRVLAIAPGGEATLTHVKAALAARIASGEVEWLQPIVGQAARPPVLLERLREQPGVHVIHFVGHGGHRRGLPSLLIGDPDDDAGWLPSELLAQQLAAQFKTFLRLVVLESCGGARPADFGSAAETFVKAGADAAVAHLWPIAADVARAFSEQLYLTLCGRAERVGDIAAAANQARLAILGSFGGSAESFSPVVFLRGRSGALFEFAQRQVQPPTAAPPTTAAAIGRLPPALERIVRRPFSILLGDDLHDASSAAFRDGLRAELTDAAEGLPMSALAQRYVFRHNPEQLRDRFVKVFRARKPRVLPAALSAAAKTVPNGVHATLLRIPLLELAIAQEQPSANILVVQPRTSSALVYRRPPGQTWQEVEEPISLAMMGDATVILRLYRGYLAGEADESLEAPLLTEDDYLQGSRSLERALPAEVVDAIFAHLMVTPSLLMNMSLVNWHHRLLLHNLFRGRSMPYGTVAIVDPGCKEREAWSRGSSLPGASPVEVVEGAEDFIAACFSQLALSRVA